MFGATERITTVSRREILREQVFEGLFQADITANEKLEYSEQLNELFAGQYRLTVNKNIAFVDFENASSSLVSYKGTNDFANDDFLLTTIGSAEIQAILSNDEYADAHESEVSSTAHDTVISNEPEIEVNASASGVAPSVDIANQEETSSDSQENNIATKPITDNRSIEEKCARINKVFRDYGINAYPVKAEMVQEAARFTRFAVELKSGETIRTLERYKTDIGIQLEANGEILIDHIKGTKFLSVDVPFAGAGKAINLLDHLDLLDDSEGKLDVVAGQKADGKFEVIDISKAPHMLIAGTTGSGKTIFLYSVIVSLLKKYPMEDLEFLIVDPKQTDFVFFEDLPNLYGGHVVTDAEEALTLIQRVNEVDKEERMAQIRSCRSRDIDSYNEKNPANRMKRLVIIIDEYADLIQTAEMQGNRKEFEKFLSMLAQKVRSLGIHMIIATQRPSANIVTGVLKANIPYRISFRLPSHTDSQTILDMSGAENLLGKGDMLLVTESDTIRMQGLYISESELENFNPYKWCKTTIQKILSQQEYCGDVINFKTCSKSFKNKTRLPNDPENWAIFKDVHEPIIARGDFEKVQALIAKTKRRAPKPKNGEKSIFCDLLFCGDCHGKLRHHTNTINKDIHYFVCANNKVDYRGECPGRHYVRADAIEQVVMLELRRMAEFLAADEEAFAELLAQKTDKELLKEKKHDEAELQKAIARNDTVSHLYEKLYEDNAIGKVSDEWFMQLSHKYETERLELKAKIKTLSQKLSECGQREQERENFTSAIRRFMRMDRLTAPLLRELIDHIDVFETEGKGKNRTQRIVIYYRFVGYVEIPEVSQRPRIKADTRKGVAVEYLTEPLPA